MKDDSFLCGFETYIPYIQTEKTEKRCSKRSQLYSLIDGVRSYHEIQEMMALKGCQVGSYFDSYLKRGQIKVVGTKMHHGKPSRIYEKIIEENK